jgi:hypothetical protein
MQFIRNNTFSANEPRVKACSSSMSGRARKGYPDEAVRKGDAMKMAFGPLDAAIVVLVGLIAMRIAGADDPRAMLAGYMVVASLSAAVPVFLAALWLGFRRN